MLGATPNIAATVPVVVCGAMDAVGKYLAQRAAPEVALVADLGGRFDAGVAIPAFAERALLPRALESLARCNQAALVVVAINAPPHATAEHRENNAGTVADIAARWPVRHTWHGGATLHELGAGRLLCLRFDTPLGKGVGYARKVPMDVLLAAWVRGSIASPYLHNTDADVVVPPDYLAVDVAPDAAAALVRPFKHVPQDESWADFTAAYEARLRHHVLGLRAAGSPFAFHSIGSVMAVHARRYAEVRGVPLRAAAEDFYLLNKLAKLGPIITTTGAPVLITGRPSDRVPFGTGAAIARAAKGEPILAYNPGCYSVLGALLSELAEPNKSNERSEPESIIDRVANRLRDEHQRSVWRAAAAKRGLQPIADDLWSLPQADRPRRAAERFDGFATLKLIHALRDAGLACLPVAEAVRRSPFCIGSPPDLQNLPAWLAAAEAKPSRRSE